MTTECEQSQQLLNDDSKEYEPRDPQDGASSGSRLHAREPSWRLLITSFCALAFSILCNVILLLSIVRTSENHVSGEELPSLYGMPPSLMTLAAVG